MSADSAGPPSVAYDQSGQALLQCPMRLTVVNLTSARLNWLTSVLHYYPGGDTTVHGDSLVFWPASVAAIWGAPQLLPREGRSTTWLAAAPAPYYGVVQFRFQNDSTGTGFGVVTASFRCGITGIGARPGAGAPLITTFSVSGPDTVPPNGYLHLNLAASASNGLWTAVLHKTDGCDNGDWTLAWPDTPHAFSALDGSLAVHVPINCVPGPFAVTVTVRDAFLRQSVDTVTAVQQ